MADKEHPCTRCKHYDICGRDVEGNQADGLCILHSADPAKDAHTFAEALAIHREHHGDSFIAFVFPGEVAFRRATFSGKAIFSGATFNGEAAFSQATFNGEANFFRARFNGEADFFQATFNRTAAFGQATFSERANFGWATFNGTADLSWATFSERVFFDLATFNECTAFDGTTFNERAAFRQARFNGTANFEPARFNGEADFGRARFNGMPNFGEVTFNGRAIFDGTTFSERTAFDGTRFSGGALFAGSQEDTEVDYIFAGTAVDFRRAVIDSPDAVTFLQADLTECQFLDTDLRKVQLVSIKWLQKGRRVRVYDDIAWGKAEARIRPWDQIERLYRELKQNYEDRRDYERAGDFHYSEKEMRRQNPDTARGLRFFLTLYWLFSGYGERYLRPLFWAGLLFVGSTIGYMWWGLRLKAGEAKLAWANGWDWLQGAYYSFRVMTLLKPDDWIPLGYAHVMNTFQTLLGPLFLGLFALALRQRLKR